MVCNYTNVTIKCGWFTHCCPNEIGCCLSVWTVIWTAITLVAGVAFFVFLVYWACRTTEFRNARQAIIARRERRQRAPCVSRGRPEGEQQDSATGEKTHENAAQKPDEHFSGNDSKKTNRESDEQETQGHPKDEGHTIIHEEGCLAHNEGSGVQECQCGVGMIRVWSDAEGLGGGPFISVQGINPSH